MKRLSFNSQGKLVGVDNRIDSFENVPKEEIGELQTSENLAFLKQTKKIESIFDKPHWSLYENDLPLKPLKFSNGKTQEDVVREVVELIERGKKVIFLHGVCGTGKSAIALNIARALGKASVVVPIKSLQKQYESDYMGRKFVAKKNGEKMKIAMITGRENHDSIIMPGKSCAYPFLPDTIKLTEKNAQKLNEFYKENPFVSGSHAPSLKTLKRISIAPANPYWSPILPAEIEINHLKDAKKKKYRGMYDRDYVFYHRREGCSYYDQYLAYIEADVIIFNAAKYLSEISLGRKPMTEVDIIDEADDFLDSFSNNVELNLTRLLNSLKAVVPESVKAEQTKKKAIELIMLEETNKRALGIDENKIYGIDETKVGEMLRLFAHNPELETEIEVDELNYANKALEAARDFSDSWKDTYLTYRKEEDNLFVKLVNVNLSKKFKEIVDGNKALVLMSGTLHSEDVLRNIFGIKDFEKVDAETLNQGAIEIFRTGKEFDCRYSNFKSGGVTREDYLRALALALKKAARPTLVHVNAFSDLPDSQEAVLFEIPGLMQKDTLKVMQVDDRNGELVSEFKNGKTNVLFTTKCSRGIDFPGDTCRSVVFTKYPNPNVQDTFWKILQKTHPDFYWEFYRDKARREFLQRIYRAVRSKDDHVYVLSPDSRVLQAVRDLQESELGL